MHDPLTVAYTIRNPFIRPHVHSDGWKWRPPLVTIWHRDPEKGEGGDDSCDWSGRRRPLNERERALWDALDELFHTLGNPPYYPDVRLYGEEPHGEDASRQGPVKHAQRAMYAWRRRGRRIHPRWHVHHWRIQVHPWQHARRWLFDRCSGCGSRFSWGYAPNSLQWGGGGPLYHRECTPLPMPATEGSES